MCIIFVSLCKSKTGGNLPSKVLLRENNTVKYGNYSRGMAPLLWMGQRNPAPVDGKHPMIYRVSTIQNWWFLGFRRPIHSDGEPLATSNHRFPKGSHFAWIQGLAAVLKSDSFFSRVQLVVCGGPAWFLGGPCVVTGTGSFWCIFE